MYKYAVQSLNMLKAVTDFLKVQLLPSGYAWQD